MEEGTRVARVTMIERRFPAPVDLDDGALYNTAEALIQLLRQVRIQDPSIRQIDLERKRLPTAYLKALLDAVAQSQHVTRVKLPRTGVNDQLGNLVADIVRQGTVLDLDLTRNALTDASCKLIASALPDCSLRRLMLEGNNIGDDGVIALCQAVPRTSIQVLKLGRLKITETGTTALATMLKDPDCPLRKLDLRSCSLGDTGARILAEALMINASLVSLCLGKNDIGDAGVQEIATALRINVVLQVLDLQYNPFSDTGAVAMVECLQSSNDSFQKLKLRHCNNVSDRMKEELLDSLLVNSHGPELAQRTKQALSSFLVEQESSERGYSESTTFYDESSSSSDDGDDSETLIREVPPAPASVNTTLEECVICFEVPAAQCALLPCKHQNCCSTCAEKLTSCHMCRETIVKVFAFGRHRSRAPQRSNSSDSSIAFIPTRNN